MPVNMNKTLECQQSVNVKDKIKKPNEGQLKNFEAVMSELNIGSPDDFDKQLSIQWKDAAIKKELISVFLCEIDFYNEYVQNYGIQGASFMLISIALILKNECQKHNCFLSRNDNFGFSILLKGGMVDEVQAIADNLCQSVKRAQTEHKYSSIAGVITLSIGVSSLNPKCKTALKGGAKKSLNMAKNSGGNKVKLVKSSQLMMPEEFTLEEEITSPSSNTVDSKRRELVLEKQKTNAIKPDLFAEKEKHITKPNTKIDRTYRGQTIQNKNEETKKDAPKSNNNALNVCNDDIIFDEQKSKQTKVRMYRGQVIS